MCGILGYVGGEVENQSSAIISRLNNLKHRGPDSEGIYRDELAIIGHTRLAIIDLNPEAEQPMRDRSESFIVSFNGEIYNYQELRSQLLTLGVKFLTESDTEVILNSYATWGSDAFRKFRGMFAIAIWDKSQKELILVRDAFGEKPLFYQLTNHGLVFSSELRALIGVRDSKFVLNMQAINLFLHYQFIPEPFTMVDDIFKLTPGTFMKFNLESNSLVTEKFIDIFAKNIDGLGSRTKEEHLQQIESRFSKAVSRCLVSDVPVAIALSAGVDSSAIVKYVSELIENVDVISVGYPGNPEYDERNEALKFASEIGANFHEVEISLEDLVENFHDFVWKLDEPIADPAAFAHYSVPKKAAELGYKVLLSGIGGDELFWGYDWLRSASEVNARRLTPKSTKQKVLTFLKMSRFKKDAFPDSIYFYQCVSDFEYAFKIKKKYFTENMMALEESQIFQVAGERPNQLSEINVAIARALGTTWLTSNCLALADRVSMANSVESRMPFLDIDLAEYALSLNYELDILALGRKQLFIQAMQGKLPDYVLNRRKTGFQPPVIEWMTSLVRTNSHLFQDSELVKERIITRESANKILTQSETIIWPELFFTYKLLMLELWLRRVLG